MAHCSAAGRLPREAGSNGALQQQAAVSQNHKVTGAARDLWRSPSPAPPKAGDPSTLIQADPYKRRTCKLAQRLRDKHTVQPLNHVLMGVDAQLTCKAVGHVQDLLLPGAQQHAHHALLVPNLSYSEGKTPSAPTRQPAQTAGQRRLLLPRARQAPGARAEQN